MCVSFFVVGFFAFYMLGCIQVSFWVCGPSLPSPQFDLWMDGERLSHTLGVQFACLTSPAPPPRAPLPHCAPPSPHFGRWDATSLASGGLLCQVECTKQKVVVHLELCLAWNMRFSKVYSGAKLWLARWSDFYQHFVYTLCQVWVQICCWRIYAWFSLSLFCFAVSSCWSLLFFFVYKILCKYVMFYKGAWSTCICMV